MSLCPIGSNIMDGAAAGRGMPKGQVMEEKWPGVMFSQFEGAEMVAQKFNVTKEEMDKFGVISHQRATLATKNGYFANEIVPVKGFDKKTGSEVVHSVDEGIRPDTTLEGLAKLPLLKPDGGRLTAGLLFLQFYFIYYYLHHY